MKRDTAYYLNRLRVEHPTAYSDLKSGKYQTANEAIVASGLRKKRSALGDARQAWGRMTSAEKVLFVRWLKTAPGVVTPARILSPATDSERRLLPATRAKLLSVMGHRFLESGDIMREMGLDPLDTSIGNALRNGWRVSTNVATHLSAWLAKQ